jgi:hypothetical protein
MFDKHTDWTDSTCYYAAAFHRMHYRLLAGPYRTFAEAEALLPFAQDWALQASGDPAASSYRYAVFTSVHGHYRSILGELKPPKPGVLTRFDRYEIGPCRRLLEDGKTVRFYYEACAAKDADVWTLYGHIPGQGAEAIGDFDSREQAEEIYARITGEPYAG